MTLLGVLTAADKLRWKDFAPGFAERAVTRGMKNAIAPLSTIALVGGLGCIVIGCGMPGVARLVAGGTGLGIVVPRLDSDEGPHLRSALAFPPSPRSGGPDPDFWPGKVFLDFQEMD